MDRLVRSAKYARKIVRHTVIGDPAERTLAHARDIGCDFLIAGPAHGKIVRRPYRASRHSAGSGRPTSS